MKKHKPRKTHTEKSALIAAAIDEAADEVRKALSDSGVRLTVHTSERWTSFRHWKFWDGGTCLADYWPATGSLHIPGRGSFSYADPSTVWERLRVVLFAPNEEEVSRE